tara:strand:- start:482 stop:793 length:312 start_codon:yes stop_codon:yes gene_type:complete
MKAQTKTESEENYQLPFCQETWDSCGGPLSTETKEKYGLEEWDNGFDLGNDPDGPLGLYVQSDGRIWVAEQNHLQAREGIVELSPYDEVLHLNHRLFRGEMKK